MTKCIDYLTLRRYTILEVRESGECKMNNTMLSDRIEKFILELLNKQSNDELLLKRKDVADLLECAPSQVTYVINTRFSSDNRFIVESRRGSGGYIKIRMRQANHTEQVHIPDFNVGTRQKSGRDSAMGKDNPNSIESIEKGLDGYFRMLADYDIITGQEYRLICMMTHTMLEYCPESHRREAAKTMIHRIEWALKGE